MEAKRLDLRFQFLYGAIRRVFDVVLEVDGIVFQFLYGAIRSFDGTINNLAVNEFQFLYGAIRSESRIKTSDVLKDFNSYMVRLEVSMCFSLIMLSLISIPIWCD